MASLRRLGRISVATASVLVAGLLAAPSASSDVEPVRVSVNTRAGLATMPETGLGINHAVWDTHLGSAEVADLLGAAGVRLMRYPGGSYGDIYHWETHTAPGGFVAPNTDFDTFMGGVRRAGGQAMVIANYGTGTPQEAAGWVREANIVKGYGVRYWEIGNELYGNGHYGAQWEADDHPDKSPAGYATNVVEFATAMKAVDPTIKIGAVLTTPANWPDGIVAGGDSATWNRTVLSIAGPHIDFVILHWYPGGSSADALSKSDQIGDMLYLVRRDIAAYGGQNADRLGIALTEMNISVGKNTQPGALFAAEAYSSLLENGVFTVDWWNTHNGIGTVSTVAGQTDYDDFGVLSSASCNADGVCQPALNTPFAPYHGIRMMSLFARPGDQFVRAATSDPLVSAHAVRRPGGGLALLLINKDPDNARTVAVDYTGFVPAAGAPTVHSFTNGATAIATGQTGSATSQTLAPYSLTTLE
ncbi:MAG TPA: alpha-L-arabinofuranosidase, partial [Actinophytocola sp.]|uniref:alpha-L-arabinofuranosidase n=1 Tax=Actinophytocola sp. TaxID=1872138 RepID=UPI002DDD43F5